MHHDTSDSDRELETAVESTALNAAQIRLKQIAKNIGNTTKELTGSEMLGKAVSAPVSIANKAISFGRAYEQAKEEGSESPGFDAAKKVTGKTAVDFVIKKAVPPAVAFGLSLAEDIAPLTDYASESFSAAARESYDTEGPSEQADALYDAAAVTSLPGLVPQAKKSVLKLAEAGCQSATEYIGKPAVQGMGEQLAFETREAEQDLQAVTNIGQGLMGAAKKGADAIKSKVGSMQLTEADHYLHEVEVGVPSLVSFDSHSRTHQDIEQQPHERMSPQVVDELQQASNNESKRSQNQSVRSEPIVGQVFGPRYAQQIHEKMQRHYYKIFHENPDFIEICPEDSETAHTFAEAHHLAVRGSYSLIFWRVEHTNLDSAVDLFTQGMEQYNQIENIERRKKLSKFLSRAINNIFATATAEINARKFPWVSVDRDCLCYARRCYDSVMRSPRISRVIKEEVFKEYMTELNKISFEHLWESDQKELENLKRITISEYGFWIENSERITELSDAAPSNTPQMTAHSSTDTPSATPETLDSENTQNAQDSVVDAAFQVDSDDETKSDSPEPTGNTEPVKNAATGSLDATQKEAQDSILSSLLNTAAVAIPVLLVGAPILLVHNHTSEVIREAEARVECWEREQAFGLYLSAMGDRILEKAFELYSQLTPYQMQELVRSDNAGQTLIFESRSMREKISQEFLDNPGVDEEDRRQLATMAFLVAIDYPPALERARRYITTAPTISQVHP